MRSFAALCTSGGNADLSAVRCKCMIRGFAYAASGKECGKCAFAAVRTNGRDAQKSIILAAENRPNEIVPIRGRQPAE